MTAPTRCTGGTHVTPPTASSCTCGDITRVTAAAPPADGGLREAVVEALYGVTWPDGEPKLHMARRHVAELADAALTVLAAHLGQQQAAIDRVKALLSPDGVPLHDSKRITVRELRAALGADL